MTDMNGPPELLPQALQLAQTYAPHRLSDIYLKPGPQSW